MQEQSYKAVLQVQKQMYSDKVVKIFPSSQNKSKCVVPKCPPIFCHSSWYKYWKATSNQIHLFSVIFYNIVDLQMKCVLPLMQISPDEHAFDSFPET